MKIGNRYIGPQDPVFVIAEACINHNGEMNIAKQLVDIAKNAGCDAVKFQTFKRDKSDFPNTSMEEYKKYRDFPNLSYDEFIELKKYCDSKKIIFFSTPFSLSAIDFLAPIVPAFKIASPSITSDYFVKRIRLKKLPIIASVGSIVNQNGMATREEINHFLNIISMNQNLALLYCVSKYPCYNFDADDFNEFREYYSGYPIGYSSHSKDINYSLCAVENGADIIEQHITISDDFKCPDSKVSLNPQELTDLVKGIRELESETIE
jgi:sialic acid synthase SpsE